MSGVLQIHDFVEGTCCTFCNKPFKWRNQYTIVDQSGKGYVKEVELITAHAGCRTLLSKYQKLQSDLLDTEWKLFKLQNQL